MKNRIKTLMVCLVVAAALVMVGSTAIAQVGFGFPPLWYHPSFSSQPLQVPTWEDPFKGEGDILVDNFEYWDSPYNHGWRQAEPAYPVYGFGMGYATIFNTLLDLQQGSRVLDVYRPPSVFLIGTPYEKHGILYGLRTPPSARDADGDVGIDLSKNPVVSFEFRAPLGIEPWDIFELDVIGENGDNRISIRLLPLQPPYGAVSFTAFSTVGMYGYSAAVTGFNRAGELEVTVSLGRGILDGSWHVVWIDLNEAIDAALRAFEHRDYDPNDKADWLMDKANAVMASGQMFRMDNLIFRADKGHPFINYPDLFEMGPLYAQIFEPYRYLFIADYEAADEDVPSIMDLMLDPENFITDPNEIESYWVSLGADPNKFLGKDGEALDPNISDLMGRDFTVDPTLPIFADPNFRVGGSVAEKIIDMGTLGWNATTGGYGAHGVQAFLLQPLIVYPYDGMPTYIPAYLKSLKVIETYGKAHYSPGLVFMLESALWNAGVELWPNIAAFDYTPYVFEDLIVTIEVTNGVHSDVRTFPISVVNYPVENYPPVVQLDIYDQIFYVGEVGKYAITFIDPDCFVFSMSGSPATSHTPAAFGMFRTDMDDLYFRASINGLPSYQYGPWIEKIIDPGSGLISWTPKFEGANQIIVSCTDNRGATAFSEIVIFAVQSGTWLNHPPLIFGGPTQPVVIKAGEEVILHTPNFAVKDPDGDELYASCNIGSCGRDANGNFIWTFHSNFPGSYLVEIIFYDIRGGYAVMEFFLDVNPWWSY